MNAELRHRAIVAAVERDGRAAVAELALIHGVTVETIRRDLAALDRAGALRKVHGGAVPAPVLATPETGVVEREASRSAAKDRIAACALAALDLRPATTLLLDAGTTTGAFARHLPEGLGLTVITDSVLIAAGLAARTDLTVRVLGGLVRGLTQAAVGSEALGMLTTLRADLAVLGANGLTAEHGLSTPDPDEAAVKRAMVAAARRVIVLADSTKIGQEHLVSFADTDDVDVLVTDAAVPAPLTTHLTSTGTEVLVA